METKFVIQHLKNIALSPQKFDLFCNLIQFFPPAILGDMERTSGQSKKFGQIAYVSQQAWIQNMSLQSNILFSKDFDQDKYSKVIQSCALKDDLKLLANRDQTEIGENGINLSGGQKQRVALARAVYFDADIYLLDDPLSGKFTHSDSMQKIKKNFFFNFSCRCLGWETYF